MGNSRGYILFSFKKRFENRGKISRRHGPGRPSKITEEYG